MNFNSSMYLVWYCYSFQFNLLQCQSCAVFYQPILTSSLRPWEELSAGFGTDFVKAVAPGCRPHWCRRMKTHNSDSSQALQQGHSFLWPGHSTVARSATTCACASPHFPACHTKTKLKGNIRRVTSSKAWFQVSNSRWLMISAVSDLDKD